MPAVDNIYTGSSGGGRSRTLATRPMMSEHYSSYQCGNFLHLRIIRTTADHHVERLTALISCMTSIMQGMVAGEKQRKAKTKMGESQHRYVWNDDNSKQSGQRQA